MVIDARNCLQTAKPSVVHITTTRPGMATLFGQGTEQPSGNGSGFVVG